MIFLRYRGSVSVTHPVQLHGADPLVPVLRVLGSEVPHAVVHADVQPALVKLMRLGGKRDDTFSQ